MQCEEKTALTNNTLNIVWSEILMLVNTVTGTLSLSLSLSLSLTHTHTRTHARAHTHTHTHTHRAGARGLFYGNACNEITYFSAALWQC